MTRFTTAACYVVVLVAVAAPSYAQTESPPMPAESGKLEAVTPEPLPKVPPPIAPYSLPWQLRPIQPGNVIRLDSALAFADDRTTSASTLLVSYKVLDWLAPVARVGFVANSPETGDSGTSFENPVLGALGGFKLSPDLKLSAFVGFALPLGQGGGTSPSLTAAQANTAGVLARSAMDNAMFATNYFTVFPGVGIAYVKSGLTIQAEVTLLQLTKARGPSGADSSNTNFTSGVHVGYFVLPSLSFGAELRHQRWLSTPTAIETNDSLRDNSTIALGPRFHMNLGKKNFLRPGVAFAMPLDDPMSQQGYKVLFFDVPFSF